jgi:hypothetical protein
MCKFSTYPSAGKYACPEKAWMDEEKILVWIDVSFMLWKAAHDADNPSLQLPLIVLDAFRV